MPFRRGAALSTASTLGFADNADVGPTAGSGFFRRWPEDLAALQELGVSDVRLTLDWPRLQPKPGMLDADWAERFEQMIVAARAIDLTVWVTLHDGSVPRWFDDEGGLDDDEALTRWWPRWVERIADRFGDVVDGWIPFAELPAGAAVQPWRDTWGILEGAHPVVASIDPTATAAEGFVGRCTAIGLAFPPAWEIDDDVADDDIGRAAERWGQLLRDSADAADLPVVVPGFDPRHGDPARAAAVVQQLVVAVDEAIADGVEVVLCCIDPAISVPDGSAGLLDRERAPTPVARNFLA